MNDMLSICIPTYNRSIYLEETLRCFIKQVKKYEIPIYVSDNMSNDNTHYVLNRLKSEYHLLFYRSNDRNMGIDMNIISVVRMAKSKYVWLFGDDDLITECAIDKILDKIEQNYDLLIVNSSTYNRDFSEIIEASHLDIQVDRYYSSFEADKLFKETAAYTTFIGSLIVKRKYWNEIEYKHYLGTDFVHSGIIYNYIINRNAYVIHDSLIKIRLQNSSWSHRQFEVWLINWPKVVWSLPNSISEDSKKSVVNRKAYNNWKTLVVFRAKSSYGNDSYKQYIATDMSINVMLKTIYRMISVMPVLPIKILYVAWLYMVKPKNYKYLLKTF